MKKILIVVVLISTFSLYSQNKTIKGKVIDEYFEAVRGVSIVVNDTVIGETDANGVFKVDILIDVKNILFESLGLEPTRIELTDYCNEIEVVVLLSGSYNFKSLKKVNRHRMRKFKMLSKLHKEAFLKGMFITEKACYTQGFICSERM